MTSDDVLNVDNSKMSQVIRNFMPNAIKFTPEKWHIKVSVKFEKENEQQSNDSISSLSERNTANSSLRNSVQNIWRNTIDRHIIR